MIRQLSILLSLAWLAVSVARGITLDEALERTLKDNPRIQQAQTGVERAAGQRLVFRSIALPDVGIVALAGAQGGDRAGQDSIEAFAFPQGTLRQPLFHAAIPASLRRGEIEALIAAQQVNIAVVEQLHQARLAFYGALYARSLEEFGRSQRLRLDENIVSERARYEAGSTDRKALGTATLLARELDPQIEEARRAYGKSVLELATAMGSDLGARSVLPGPRGALSFVRVNFDVEQETPAALERRPDLQLARLLVRAAGENQRIAAAGYYPRLDLTVFGRYIPETNIRQASSGSPQRADDIISSEIAAGAGYTWRVIDNGRVRGAVLRAHAAREINQLQLRKLETNVRRELIALTNTLRAIAARHASLEKAVDVAEKNVAVVENSWRQGLASQLEFRTAETDLLATRRGLLDAAYQQQVALADWDRATGRYFQISEVATNVHSSKP